MTLWFAISLFVVMGVMYAAMHIVLKQTMTNNAESIVQAYGAQASSYIEAENGAVKFDESMPDTESGVYFQIFDSDGQSVYSYGIPGDISALTPDFNQPRILSAGGTSWMIYDQKITEDNSQIGWVRSVKSLKYIDETLRNLFVVFLCLCPAFLILALLIGYFLVRRTLLRSIKSLRLPARLGEAIFRKG
jgi:hypothetical protein